jgi:hypothetical protein
MLFSEDVLKFAEIPPTVVGGLLKPDLHNKQGSFLNPPNGSWGIVKAQPSPVCSRKVGL